MDYCPTITGMFQGDLIIKAAVELAIEDIRKNPWIIEDIFGSLLENPYLKYKYGIKEINRAKEFILNNDIPVYMRHRVDKQEFPCVTISIGDSKEDNSLATLGDQSPFVEEYTADEIGKPIKFIIPRFTPVSYDNVTGIVEVPTTVEDYQHISEGMIAVDPDTGDGYIINGKAGENGFQIQAGATIAGDLAIVPQYQVYRARRERTGSQETYNIGCHTEGDPSTLIFLYGLVKYSLFRYKEGLLEANSFQLSRLSSTDLIKNEAFGVENVYSRWITLTGQIEESWIKSPFRIIEAIDINDEESELKQGIKILSNEETVSPSDEDVWITIDEDGGE